MGDSNRIGSRRRAQSETCPHDVTTSTITAGMRRIVCEKCAHVSVEFVEATVRVFPERDDVEIDLTATDPAPRRTAPRRCFSCGGRAVFLTPEGLACPPHAWEAASIQEAIGEDIWIPIRIERTARRPDRAR